MAINKKLIHFSKQENFDNEVANNNILDTSICFIKDSKSISTHGTIYPTVNWSILIPTPASVGDIAYWDGSTVKTVPLSNWNTSLGTPIGVVIIGTGFAPDGKARIISLDSLGNLFWDSYNGYDTDTPVPNYNVVPNTDNASSTTGSNSYGFLPSDRSDWTGVQSYVDPSAKYYGYTPYIPSPYLGNSPNPAYYQVLEGGNALSDFDGLGNTRILAGLGSNYQAATACWNYKDSANSNLQWYLPAMGELGYLITRFELINQSIQAVGGTVVPVGDALWGSSELYDGSYYYAYYLNTGNCIIDSDNKCNGALVRAVCII